MLAHITDDMEADAAAINERQRREQEEEEDAAIEAAAASDAFGLANLGATAASAQGSSRPIASLPSTSKAAAATSSMSGAAAGLANPDVLTEVGERLAPGHDIDELHKANRFQLS